MNKTFFLIFFSIALNTWAQNSNKTELQLNYFNKENNHLSNSNLEEARLSFYFSYQESPETKLGKTALKKSDSIKLIIRGELIINIQGTWKWTETGSNWCVAETSKGNSIDRMIEIKEKQISFYQIVNSEKKMINSELINFINKNEPIPSSTDILYSNNQIWRIDIDIENEVLKLTNSGESNANGRTVIVCGNEKITYKKAKTVGNNTYK